MLALLAQAGLEYVPEPTSAAGDDLIAYLLLLLLAAVIVLGAVCLVLVLHFVGQRRREQTAEFRSEGPGAGAVAWRNPGVLMVPARWMAVRATTVREVRNALDLSNATPCSIEDGLA